MKFTTALICLIGAGITVSSSFAFSSMMGKQHRPDIISFFLMKENVSWHSAPGSLQSGVTPFSKHNNNKRRLQMSSNSDMNQEEEEDEALSDELAKLIGKRASISKKTSSNSSNSSSSAGSTVSTKVNPNDPNVIDETTAKLYEGKTGMDIFEMPEFKSKRPLRKPKEMEDSSRGGSSADKNAQDDREYYIDYQADYDDENDFHVPNRIGFTTVAWGDTGQGFKSGKKLKKKEIKAGFFLAGDLQVAYDELMAAGITFVDTSENYGIQSRSKSLSAEQILCQCMDTNTDAYPIVASTLSNPWKSIKLGSGFRFGQSAILNAIEASAERLGTGAIDLYQIPGNMFYIGTPNCVAKAVCAAMDQGLINNVGVSNFGKNRMRSFVKKLDRIGGYSLTSNQFEFSLINRKAYKSGLIAACKAMGVIPIARDPLGGGLASGVYTSSNPTGGQTGSQPFDFKTLDKYTTLHDVLATVQQKVQKRLEKENNALKDKRSRYNGSPINTEVTTTQVAINYVVAKGCVPMPSIKNPKEADELIGCLGWSLTDDEVKMLDNAADMSDKGVVV